MIKSLALRQEDIAQIQKRLSGYFRLRLSDGIFREWGADLPAETIARFVETADPDEVARALAESAADAAEVLVRFLLGVARYIAKETIRRAKRSRLDRRQAFDSGVVERAEFKAAQRDLRQTVRREAVTERLQQARQFCTRRQWQALEMSSQGKSYREIARALNVAASSIGPLLARARVRIRRGMGYR